MSKRQRPWDSDHQRQMKTHVTEKLRQDQREMNEVYKRTHALLFEGARRAFQPQQPDLLGESAVQPEMRSSPHETDQLQEMELDQNSTIETIEMRQSRHEMLKKIDKRDPSSVLSHNVLHRFMDTSNRVGETQQEKHYKQLNIDSFMCSRNQQQPTEQMEDEDGNKKDQKDVNGNKDMEF